MKQVDFNLLIVHARGASRGFGCPTINKNNHPFTSTCKSIGLIHNGKIPIEEYSVLTQKFEVNTECDSEILLRIFESANHQGIDSVMLNNETITDELLAKRLMGLRNIWSYIEKGHMAVAVGERVNESIRRLFLFRNQYRSLWLIDLRKQLGQVFFSSTPEIWQAAFRNSKARKYINERVKLIDLPVRELWSMEVTNDEPVVKTVDKYNIFNHGSKLWKPDGDFVKIPKTSPVAKIVSKLGEDEQVVCNTKKNSPSPRNVSFVNTMEYEDNYDDPTMPDAQDLQEICGRITASVKELEQQANRMLKTGALTENSLLNVVHSLEQVELDIDGTMNIMVR